MSEINSIESTEQRRGENWTSLRLTNVYRLALASIFFSQAFLDSSPLVKIVDLSLYAWTSFSYLLTALTLMLWSWIDRRNFQIQITIQVYLDIVALIILLHACGGISTGLGLLLIIPIAVVGLIGEEPMATVFAALATVGLLSEFLYATSIAHYPSGTSTQVGLLGVALFVTAIVTQSLTKKLEKSEAVIREKELDVANLSAINSEIIQNMQSGVIALDHQDRVRHINNIALSLLAEIYANRNVRQHVPFNLDHELPELYQELQLWRQSDRPTTQLLSSRKSGLGIQVSFNELNQSENTGTLVFLENVSRLKQQMQQSKLASLGHLTANIAHEIRNPLGAISHAAELLAESTELPSTDKRLTEIIKQHSGRINEIIEDIMQISKGHKAALETINLNSWLVHFLENFCHGDQEAQRCFELSITDKDVAINFDQGHLNRVMVNLCQNALTHSNSAEPIQIRVSSDANRVLCLEVADRGYGISSKEMDKIFEPFYTTNPKGSGLGLYIVSQLCELNDAIIEVKSNEWNGASFVIKKEIELINHE